ncbi:MAG: hypothetical protein ACLR78_12590 [Roseburia sp.]
MNKMYNEGILDPEFTQPRHPHEDYIAKIASGRVLALFDTDWDYGDGEKVLKADGKYGKTVMHRFPCHGCGYQVPVFDVSGTYDWLWRWNHYFL